MKSINNGSFKINQKVRFNAAVWARWQARRDADAITRAALSKGIQEMRSSFVLSDRRLQNPSTTVFEATPHGV